MKSTISIENYLKLSIRGTKNWKAFYVMCSNVKALNYEMLNGC